MSVCSHLLLMLIIFTFKFGLLSGCTVTSAVVVQTDREINLGWTKHVSQFDGKKIYFELPPGGVFNPEPNTRIFKFGAGSFGGVTYGQRAQGQQLASLMVLVELRKYPPNLDISGWNYKQFADWANSQVQDFLILENSKLVNSNKVNWHYQLVRSKKSGLVNGEYYLLPFNEKTYLSVHSVLWDSFASSDANVSKANEILDRMFKSIRIE